MVVVGLEGRLSEVAVSGGCARQGGVLRRGGGVLQSREGSRPTWGAGDVGAIRLWHIVATPPCGGFQELHA